MRPFTFFLPLIFFQVYLIIAELCFAFGPLDLPITNSVLMVGFLLAAHVAILLGYAFPLVIKRNTFSSDTVHWHKYFWTSTACTLIVALLAVVGKGDGSSISSAILDPGSAYQASQEMMSDQSSDSRPIVAVFRMACAPLLAMFLPVGVIFWSEMSRAMKWAWIASFLGVLVQPILAGSGKILIEMMIVVPWFILLKHFHEGESKFRSRKLLQNGFAIAIVFVVGFAWFTYTRQSRYKNEFPIDSIGWSRSYGLELPEFVESPIYMACFYLSQGYYGLAGCLDLPFHWTYGVGNSVFMTKYFGILTGGDWVSGFTYPARLENVSEWRVANYWHTVYPWLASDLTFPGALIFVGIAAYLFATSWYDAARANNLFAASFLGQIVLFFYYIPANNCRLSITEDAIAFWVTLLMWKASSVRKPNKSE